MVKIHNIARCSLTWFALILSLLFVCSPAFSEVPKNYWQPIGPWGGDRYEVFIDPVDHQKVYVVGGAIHVSPNGGEYWQPLMSPSVATRGIYAYSMGINRQNPSETYVGTSFEGVWKSSNGGALWTPVNDTLPDTDWAIRSVTLDNANQNILYIGIDNTTDNANAAAYRSVDGGATWTRFDNGLPMTEITAIFQNPLNNNIYAGTYGAGIYKYDSAGESWVESNLGLNPPHGLNIIDMTFDPLNEQVLYVCTKKDWVYKSTDGGMSWQHIAYPESLYTEYPPMAYYLRIDPNNSNRLWIGAMPGSNYANESPFYRSDPDQDIGGLFRSTDGGSSWQKVMPDYGGFRLTIDPTETIGSGANIRSKVMYLTSGGIHAVFKSVDGGETFQIKITGIGGIWMNALLQHPADSSKLFAAAETGLFFSFDGGAKWSHITPAPNSQPVYTWSMAVDPDDPSVFYYATGDPAWAWPENKGLFRINLNALDPAQEMNNVHGEQLVATRGIGIWKVYIPTSSAIYLATQDRGILRSNDGGQSWVELNNGLNELSVSCIAFDENGSPLYAGTRSRNGSPTWYPELNEAGSIYKWVAESGQWSRVGTTKITRAVFDITTPPEDSGTVYAGTLSGLFISKDSGITWTKQNVGIQSQFGVSDIEIHPDDPNILFLSSWDTGVYASADGGENWTAFSRGMTHLLVQDILVDWMQPDVLYAATLGGSVQKLTSGSAPVINSIMANGTALVAPFPVQVKEKELLSVTMNASDPDLEDVLTYTAYYNGIPIPQPGENPDFPLTFNPSARILEWTPDYGTARAEPYTVVFVITDGVFAIEASVEITVNAATPVYTPGITVTLNKSSFKKYEYLDVFAHVKNPGSPVPVDLYILVKNIATLQTITIPYVKGVTLPAGLDLNLRLIHYQFVNFTYGNYTLTGVFVPAGVSVTEKTQWLASSEATFTYSK
ncbi:MAG: hypothetical protein L6290_02870 [Thermodesulfovibrionales bacterium]|nr:hypothetical protein [Thermodesulfovibrionales bacterium]